MAYTAYKDKEKRVAYMKAYRAARLDELKAYMKAYRAAHLDERKAYDVAYRAAHKEEKKARMKAYNASHKEDNKAYFRAYHAAHLEERKAYSVAYSAAHPEKAIWRSMVARTTNPRSDGYEDYGLEFIRMRSRWRGPNGFANFFRDMGPRPSPEHSIDRIDGDYGYTPENCRWATKREQDLNRISTRWITFNGRTLCITDWAAEIGICLSALQQRLKMGWSIERALTEAPRKQKRNPKK
jgi:hypothetical protein